MAPDATAAASNTSMILSSLTPSAALESKHKLSFLLRVQNRRTKGDADRSGDIPPIFNGTAGWRRRRRCRVAPSVVDWADYCLSSSEFQVQIRSGRRSDLGGDAVEPRGQGVRQDWEQKEKALQRRRRKSPCWLTDLQPQKPHCPQRLRRRLMDRRPQRPSRRLTDGRTTVPISYAAYTFEGAVEENEEMFVAKKEPLYKL